MNPTSKPPQEYLPPPPDVPVIESTPPPIIMPTPELTNTAPASIPDLVEETDPESENNAWIIAILKDAWTYPLRKDGWAILIPGGLLALLLTIGTAAPVIGLVAAIFGIGYFSAYYFDIVGTTISGDETPPEWPVITNFMEDVFRPAIQMIGVMLIAYVPGLLYSAINGAHVTEGFIASLLFFISAAYFPMACIGLVMTGSIATALPHRVIPAIKRCLPEYVVPVTFLIMIKVVTVLIQGIAIILPAFISMILLSLVGQYFLMMQARITGLTCRKFRDRIQWG